jgi:hypothetical protein
MCTATSEMEDLPDLRCTGRLRRGACLFDGPLGTCYVVYPNHETDRSIIGLDSVEEANLQYFCPSSRREATISHRIMAGAGKSEERLDVHSEHRWLVEGPASDSGLHLMTR